MKISLNYIKVIQNLNKKKIQNRVVDFQKIYLIGQMLFVKKLKVKNKKKWRQIIPISINF